MLDSFKVGISTDKTVKKHDKGGNSRRGENLTPDTLVDSRTEKGEYVIPEAIGVAKADPVIVRKDSATILSRFFAVRNVFDFGQRRSEFGVAKK